MSSQENSIPWINSEYVKALIIKSEGHDKIELTNFECSSGAAAGENMAGVINRLKVNYLCDGNKKSASFILKSSPAAGALADLLEDLGIFEREVYTYETLLKELEALLPDLKLAPRLIFSDKNAMVLEDLMCSNFELANRKKRFDFHRAKLVIAKIAKLHAGSIVLYENDPSSMEYHKMSAVDGNEMTPLTFFFSVSMQEVLETLRSIPDFQEWLSIFENYDIVAEEKKVFTRGDNDRLHVLNHGDLWINNIFFKYDEKRNPIDTMLVDYQESYWGSPGLDLVHFLYTSCNYDVHDNHFDELIAFYHEHLVSALRQLKYKKIPTLDDIRYEVRSKLQQGLVCLFSVVPVQMIENPEHANPENFVADSEEAQQIRRIVYANPKYIELLKVMLPKIIQKGVLGQAESHF